MAIPYKKPPRKLAASVDWDRAKRLFLFLEKSPTEIGEEVGLSALTVCKYLKKKGVNTRNRLANCSPAAFIEEYKTSSMREIGESHKIGESRIRLVLKRGGAKIRTRSEATFLANSKQRAAFLRQYDWLSVAERIREGAFFSAEAKRIGISVYALQEGLKQRGYKVKSRKSIEQHVGALRSNKALAAIDKEALKERYLAGVDVKPLSQETGISQYAIRKMLRGMGVVLRGKKDTNLLRWQKAKGKLDWDIIAADYLTTKSVRVLACKYGHSRRFIRDGLRLRGVKIDRSAKLSSAYAQTVDWNAIMQDGKDGLRPIEIWRNRGRPSRNLIAQFLDGRYIPQVG
jgi:hypothetical protein